MFFQTIPFFFPILCDIAVRVLVAEFFSVARSEIIDRCLKASPVNWSFFVLKVWKIESVGGLNSRGLLFLTI